MVALIYVPRNMIEKVWNAVEKDIKNALERSGNYANSNHFKKNCIDGLFHCWVLWDKDAERKDRYYGVVITEIIDRPLQRCLNIRIMTGKDRENWQHMIRSIEDFGRQHNCDKMELVARPGWERVLKKFEYKKSHVLLEKNLKE